MSTSPISGRGPTPLTVRRSGDVQTPRVADDLHLRGGATGSVQAERNYVQERIGLDRFDPSTNARLPGQLGRVAGQVPTLAEGERRVGGQVSALSGRTGIGGEEGAPAVTLQGRALSAEGLAEGSYRLNGQGLRANGQVRAGLVLGEGRAEALGGRVAGSVTAGATASMAGELTVDPTTGRYQGQVTVDNFVGVRAEARARVGTDNLSATGTVAAQAGLGLTARLEAGLNGNRLRGRMEFGAALGIGARAGVQVDVNLPPVVANAGRAAVSAAGEAGRRLSESAVRLGERIGVGALLRGTGQPISAR